MLDLRVVPITLAVACLSACNGPSTVSLADYRPIDLTYTFDEKTIYWPTGKHFEHERVSWGPTEGGYWHSSYNLAGSEHGGTHLDAPIHFAEGKRGVSDIPLSQLIVAAVVVDISAQCESHPDYLLSVDDLEAHQRRHGAIPKGAGVLIHTGWGRFWPPRQPVSRQRRPRRYGKSSLPGGFGGSRRGSRAAGNRVGRYRYRQHRPRPFTRFQGSPGFCRGADCLS